MKLTVTFRSLSHAPKHYCTLARGAAHGGKNVSTYLSKPLPPTSTLKMEYARFSETSVYFYQTTRRHTPADSIVDSHGCHNLNSHTRHSCLRLDVATDPVCQPHKQQAKPHFCILNVRRFNPFGSKHAIKQINNNSVIISNSTWRGMYVAQYLWSKIGIVILFLNEYRVTIKYKKHKDLGNES
jgi:hypothetical protein